MKAIKNIRLKNYNYKTNGYYFVTICTDYRKPFLQNNTIKDIVVAELARLNDLNGVKIDYYVIMPNHIHLIIVLEDSKYSLFDIVKRFKSKTTVFVNKQFANVDAQLVGRLTQADQGRHINKDADQGRQLHQRLWQPNYYEHIIRNEHALGKIREYIQNNPEKEKIEFDQFYERMGTTAPNKLGNYKQKGQAMIIVLVLMLFLFPIAAAFLYVSVTEMTHTRMERRFKTATALANNVLVDLMRQFSQSYYTGHYDSDSLARNEMFYEIGFSTVTITADAVRHYLYIQATGKYGKDANNPLSDKKLYAVIKFDSDITNYNFWCNTAQSWGSAVTESGRDRVSGNVSLGGSDTFNGDFIVVGNMTGVSSNLINGNLYCTGSFGSVSVAGSKYNFVPEAAWPSIDVSYYDTYYNFKSTWTRTIQFLPNGTFTVSGSTAPVTIPSGGCIIFAKSCNINISSSTVKGRVTVVASGTQGSSRQGNIWVNGNLNYANGTNNASDSDSLALMSHNYINFAKAGGLTVHATLFSQYRSVRSQSPASGTLNLYGTMITNQGASLSVYSPRNYIFDTEINKYSPPGLPEKPYLVTWHMK